MTHPVPAIARTQLIINLMVALGWQNIPETGYLLIPGPEILSAPDRAVHITPGGGPGYVTEEAGADCWSFQARVRGPDDDPLAPELAAQLFDVTVLNGSYPVTVNGVPVINLARMGSPPVPMPLNPQDRRFEYTCTYLIITGGG